MDVSGATKLCEKVGIKFNSVSLDNGVEEGAKGRTRIYEFELPGGYFVIIKVFLSDEKHRHRKDKYLVERDLVHPEDRHLKNAGDKKPRLITFRIMAVERRDLMAVILN